jgi:hypothetical protein
VHRIAFPEPRLFLETIFGSGNDSTFADAKQLEAQKALIESLPEDVRKTLRYAEIFDRMKRGEAMLMLPFELQIK